jgi:DNA sulfur modification protein DndC
MSGTVFQEIRESLSQLYKADARPWLVGFSGGKDSTLVASLVFDTIQSIPAVQRKKEVAIVCTATRVEIPAIVEMIETTLAKTRRCSIEQNPNISFDPIQ